MTLCTFISKQMQCRHENLYSRHGLPHTHHKTWIFLTKSNVTCRADSRMLCYLNFRNDIMGRELNDYNLKQGAKQHFCNISQSLERAKKRRA